MNENGLLERATLSIREGSIMVENNESQGDALTPQQRRVLPHLLSSSSIREACRKAGISHATYYRWIRDPAFRKELDRVGDESCRETINILKHHAAQAARHLVGLMKTRDPVLRRRICNDVLSHVLRFEEYRDLEGRVRELEHFVEVKKL